MLEQKIVTMAQPDGELSRRLAADPTFFDEIRSRLAQLPLTSSPEGHILTGEEGGGGGGVLEPGRVSEVATEQGNGNGAPVPAQEESGAFFFDWPVDSEDPTPATAEEQGQEEERGRGLEAQ